MSQSQDSQDIEHATSAILPSPIQAPDNKTRRYDRQLRLWAAAGQDALESSRILVISGSATSTSILKNLVLPGIGHFTIMDPSMVTPEDAGNNFFLEGYDSVGKYRAGEAVRLLSELNDGVSGAADTSNLEDVLSTNPSYITSFSLVIAHNISPLALSDLSKLLWAETYGPPLIVVRSAGFLAEFFIQFHEHAIVESHSETPPSLRIDRPFPALLEHALSLPWDTMDVTDHGHIPYVVVLVKALHDWKVSHGGKPPTSYEDKKQFKADIEASKKKFDEENFDEAIAQAYRAFQQTTVPPEVASLLSDSSFSQISPDSPNATFFHLLSALRRFTEEPPHLLPLTSALPDMKSDTRNYVQLQTLYKAQAEVDKARFKSFVTAPDIPDTVIDDFVRNAHGLKVLRGTRYGALDAQPDAILASFQVWEGEKAAATHVALSALAALQLKGVGDTVTLEALTKEAHAVIGKPEELQEEHTAALDDALGEIVRAPTADLPNVAAFLGGVVAQEAIKMITRQYVPTSGYCVIDLAGSWTKVVEG